MPRTVTQDEILSRIEPDLNSGCWLWAGNITAKGYGRYIHQSAHRLAYAVFRSSPVGRCVCHKCDTPPCVNPSHLFLGSQAENMADRDRKGRGKTAPLKLGVANGKAVLNDEMVRAIRSSFRILGSAKAVARKFDLNHGTVYSVVVGRTWGHVQ